MWTGPMWTAPRIDVGKNIVGQAGTEVAYHSTLVLPTRPTGSTAGELWNRAGRDGRHLRNTEVQDMPHHEMGRVNPTQISEYLQGCNFPCSKRDLLRYCESK